MKHYVLDETAPIVTSKYSVHHTLRCCACKRMASCTDERVCTLSKLNSGPGSHSFPSSLLPHSHDQHTTHKFLRLFILPSIQTTVLRVISLLLTFNPQLFLDLWFHRQECFFHYLYTQLHKIYVNIHSIEVVYLLLSKQLCVLMVK
jgi:hypothetical protein